MKKFLHVIALLGIIFTLASQSILASSTGFVTSRGQQLYLNGTVFKSIGVNRYNLMTMSGTPVIGCGGVFTNTELDTWFSELHQMGVTSVRFWLFQSFTQSGTNFERFNYLLSLSKKYNVKLIPVFENQWKECTQGGDKDTGWYQKGYLSPYGNYTLSLKEYIGKVVPLYKDNQQILFWQIMNEAQASDTTALYNFAKDVSGYIKSLDSNHLVSFGTIGSGQFSANAYRRIHSLQTIDLLEYHDYNAESVALPHLLSNRIKDAITLNKPLLIGESGISLAKYTPEQRASYFNNKINAYFQKGGSIYLVWSYRDITPEERSYNFTITDPLVQVIKSYTRTFYQGL